MIQMPQSKFEAWDIITENRDKCSSLVKLWDRDNYLRQCFVRYCPHNPMLGKRMSNLGLTILRDVFMSQEINLDLSSVSFSQYLLIERTFTHPYHISSDSITAFGPDDCLLFIFCRDLSTWEKMIKANI